MYVYGQYLKNMFRRGLCRLDEPSLNRLISVYAIQNRR